jgi:methyl-accepting chemotaxis protein
MNRFERNDLVVLGAIAAVALGAVIYGFVHDAVGLAVGIGALLMAASVGVALASQGGAASRTMTEIVGSVQRVSDIIGEISSAAAEQSAGMRQLNGAIGELDRSTQQNAALVEESGAAAESMRTQASRLAQAVSQFRLSADQLATANAAAAAAPRSPAPAAAAAAVATRHTPTPTPPKHTPSPARSAAGVGTSASTPSAPPSPTRRVQEPAVASGPAHDDDWTTF